MDRNYTELKSRITRNRFNYYRLNALVKKARLYKPYAKKFLTDIGCSVPTIFRYFLNETRLHLSEELPQKLATI